MLEFHLESSKQTSFKVNIIKLGNVKVQKINEDTDKPLSNVKLRFEYYGNKVRALSQQNINSYKLLNDTSTITFSIGHQIVKLVKPIYLQEYNQTTAIVGVEYL